MRDNNAYGPRGQVKRERVVLCTEDYQDFRIWKEFVDTYECPPLHGSNKKNKNNVNIANSNTNNKAMNAANDNANSLDNIMA